MTTTSQSPVSFLSVSEAADYLGLTRQGFNAANPPAPAVVVGKTKGWTEAQLDEWDITRRRPGHYHTTRAASMDADKVKSIMETNVKVRNSLIEAVAPAFQSMNASISKSIQPRMEAVNAAMAKRVAPSSLEAVNAAVTKSFDSSSLRAVNAAVAKNVDPSLKAFNETAVKVVQSAMGDVTKSVNAYVANMPNPIPPTFMANMPKIYSSAVIGPELKGWISESVAAFSLSSVVTDEMLNQMMGQAYTLIEREEDGQESAPQTDAAQEATTTAPVTSEEKHNTRGIAQQQHVNVATAKKAAILIVLLLGIFGISVLSGTTSLEELPGRIFQALEDHVLLQIINLIQELVKRVPGEGVSRAGGPGPDR